MGTSYGSYIIAYIITLYKTSTAVYNPFIVRDDYAYSERGRSYNNLRLFYSLKSACDVFELPEHRNLPGRQELIEIIKGVTKSLNPQELELDKAKKPFIVIESNDIYTRKIFSKILAYNIRGKLLRTPPDCLSSLNGVFSGSSVRRAFYALSMYVSAFNVTTYWRQKPVVMTGYWMDHFAYVLTKAYRNFPIEQIDRSVFTWPPDLLRPDIIFFLNAPPVVYSSIPNAPSPNRWKNAMSKVYKRMAHLTRPRVIITQVSRDGFKTVYPEIKRHMKEILGDRIDFDFIDERQTSANKTKTDTQ